MMRRALTLVEMLVVLLVLEVLAAILLPVVVAVRDRAHFAGCLSSERQLGLAFQAYTLDHDGVLPGSGLAGEPGGWVFCPRDWQIDVPGGALFGYVRNAAVYRCPSVADRPLTYSMNTALGFLPEGLIREPSRVILLVEESDKSVFGRGPNDGSFVFPFKWDVVSDRHAGGSALLLSDGHTHWTPAVALSGGGLGRAGGAFLP